MGSFLVVLFGVLVALLVVVGSTMHRRGQAQRMLRGLQHWSDFRTGEVFTFGDVRVEFGRGAYSGAFRSMKPENRDVWQFSLLNNRLGGRTNFSVEREDPHTRDIHELDLRTGDGGVKGFDKIYRIEGSDEDVLRGVFSEAGVQQGLHHAFEKLQFCDGLSLGRDGELQFCIPRFGYEDAAARKAASVALDLVELLERHADSSAIPLPAIAPAKTLEVPALCSVSGGSGAPVGLGSQRDV